MKNFLTRNVKHLLVTVIFIVLALFVGYFVGYDVGYETSATHITPTPSPTPVINVDINEPPKEITLDGKYVCLPHKDTSGPQTMECAFGIELQDGTYVATDMSSLVDANVHMKFQVGSKLRVTGLYVPVEQISTDIWQKYPIKGIMKVSDAKNDI